MTAARWVAAALFVVAGVILGFAIAALFITSTWGGVFTAVPCSDEETNPASLCRNGYYAHGWLGWVLLVGGLILATAVGVVGALVARRADPRNTLTGAG